MVNGRFRRILPMRRALNAFVALLAQKFPVVSRWQGAANPFANGLRCTFLWTSALLPWTVAFVH